MCDLKSRQLDCIVLFVFVAVAFLLYGWSLQAPFYYDDTYNILKNSSVHDLKYFLSYFTDPRTHNAIPENSPYRPLATATYALLWAAGDGSTLPFRLYKIVVHALTAWIVYVILCEMLGASLQNRRQRLWLILSAGIFLVHPANAETVNYISSASSLQCAFFYLLAFLFYLRKKYFLLMVAFAASVFTKEEGITLPALIVAHGYILAGRKIDKRAAVCAGAVMIFFLAVYLGMPRTVNFSNLDRWTYLFTQFRAWLQYMAWIVFPFGFAIEHMSFGFSQSFWDWPVVLSLIVHLALWSCLLWALYSRRGNYSSLFAALAFALVWFYVALLPTSSVFALSEPINEHRYYLSYALFIPLGVLVLAEWSARRAPKAVVATLGLVVVVLSMLTIEQTLIWRSPLSVWQNAVLHDATNGRAHLNLGVVYLGRGEYTQAVEEFNQCAQLMPQYSLCSANLGIAYSSLGELQKADAYFQAAYNLDPNSTIVLGQYGEFLIQKMAQYEKGLEILRKCEQISDGGYMQCYFNRASALFALKRNDDAVHAAYDAYTRHPNYRTQFEYALALTQVRKFDEAAQEFTNISSAYPNDAQSLHNLAWIAMQQGRWSEARLLWFKKLDKVPGDKPAWQNLLIVAERLNDNDLRTRAEQNLK